MPFEIRPITPDDFRAYMLAEGVAFGDRPSDADIERRVPAFAFEESLAAIDGDTVVGTAGALPFELTLPGLTTLPIPGVSWVSVLPSHRRQGILSSLMRRQLENFRARGVALAALTASESAIYRRFGYGVATFAANFEIDTHYARFADPITPSGRFAIISHEQALEVLPPLYDRIRQTRPGMLDRPQNYWPTLISRPNESLDGFGPRFYVTYTSAAGSLDGLAHYRIQNTWEHGLASGIVNLRELFATTSEAYAALWQYFLTLDLMRTVRTQSRPVDDPIRWLLADSRRVRTTRINDDLWVRLLDVPAALSARRYAAPGRLVFEVKDRFLPDCGGRFQLDAGPDGAECRRTDQSADLTLDISDLSAVFLGGVSFASLAGAGRVAQARSGVLQRADLLFAIQPAPFSGTPF